MRGCKSPRVPIQWMTAGAISAHTANAVNTDIKRALRLSPGGGVTGERPRELLYRCPYVPVRLALASPCVLASIVVVAGSLAGCGEEEQAGPEGVPLPSDFPVTQVPLIDGHVLSASGTRADGWEVTVQGPANAATSSTRRRRSSPTPATPNRTVPPKVVSRSPCCPRPRADRPSGSRSAHHPRQPVVVHRCSTW